MMKTNRMLALLAGLALVAALQTGCLISDYPAFGPDNASNDVVGCVDMDRQGNTDLLVADAQRKLWYASDPFGNAGTLISGGDARDWWRLLANNIDENETLTYGVGVNVAGYHKTSDTSVILRQWTKRPWTAQFRNKWSCSVSRQNDVAMGLGPWNFNIVPENANPSNSPGLTVPTVPGVPDNLAGFVPSAVFVDNTAVNNGPCEFQANFKAKNVGIWFTPGFCDPDGGDPSNRVQCSSIVEPGGDPANPKYNTWVMSCYGGPTFQNVLTRLPIQDKEEVTYELGRPFNFSLRSGEVSANVMPTLNEENGNIRLTLISGTVRGKAYQPTSPVWMEVKPGAGFSLDQNSPGFKELQRWALENVDLSKPFTTNGELVPFLNRNLPKAQSLIGIAR